MKYLLGLIVFVRERREMKLQRVNNYVKQHKKPFIISGAAVVVVLLALLIVNAYVVQPYSDMVNAACDGQYAEAVAFGESLPQGYKDCDAIVQFATIARDFDENDRSGYADVLDKLEALPAIENQRVKALYEDFLQNVSALQSQYRNDLNTANEISKKISAATTYSSDEELLAKASQIQAARQEYDNCDARVQSLVANVSVLETAENKISALKDAQKVSAQIGAIGTVTLDSEEKISSAADAYNSLSGDAKSYVTNHDVLVAASDRLQTLKEEKAREEQRKKEEEQRKQEEQRRKEEAQKDIASSGSDDADSHGGGTVYWVSSGEVYHSTPDCPTLSRSQNIFSGSPPSGRRPCKVCY